MTSRTTIDYAVLDEAAYDAGLDPDDAIRADYSGRGMFGDQCLGIVHDTIGQLLALIVALDHAGIELDWIGKGRQDSMGLSTITYFPGVTVENVPENADA